MLDLACGPGQVAGYLQQKGLEVLGLDLSERMVELARENFPEVDFEVGDLLNLGDEGEFAAITAFYAVVHLKDGQLPRALSEMFRALRPGGRLLLTFHSELLEGRPDYRILALEKLKELCLQAGFLLEVTVERMPVADEDGTRRGIVWASRPS